MFYCFLCIAEYVSQSRGEFHDSRICSFRVKVTERLVSHAVVFRGNCVSLLWVGVKQDRP